MGLGKQTVNHKGRIVVRQISDFTGETFSLFFCGLRERADRHRERSRYESVTPVLSRFRYHTPKPPISFDS